VRRAIAKVVDGWVANADRSVRCGPHDEAPSGVTGVGRADPAATLTVGVLWLLLALSSSTTPSLRACCSIQVGSRGQPYRAAGTPQPIRAFVGLLLGPASHRRNTVRLLFAFTAARACQPRYLRCWTRRCAARSFRRRSRRRSR
jgi:hypothetical protein